MDPISELICKLAESKRTIVFCGAGISRNSGIPSVQPLLKKLLSGLGAEEKHTDIFVNSGFPFEATMETMMERVSLNKLLAVFDVSNPNENHELIACFAKSGFVKIIITTNFDCNVEIALCNRGLILVKDFVVVTDLHSFDINNYKDKILVLKLHGTITEPANLLTTIKRIANKKNNEIIQSVFKNLFSNNSFDNILILGYSFSDHFDINPAILNMPACDKHIFITKYQSEELPTRIENNPAGDTIFRTFATTTALYCNLENVVSSVGQSMKIDLHKTTADNHWEETIENWISSDFRSDSFTNQLNCIANLFLAAGFIHIAKYYAESNLELISNGSQGKLLKMDTYAIIGKSYLKDPNARDVPEAIKYFEIALEIAKELSLDEQVNIYTGNLASCYLMQQQFVKAEELYNSTIKHFKALLKNPDKYSNAIDRITGYSIMLAHTFAKSGKFSEAFALYKKILPICENEGLISNLELGMTGYGIAHILSGDYKTGLEIFDSAYPKAKANTSIDRVLSLFFLICSWTKKEKGTQEAINFYEKEISYIKTHTDFDRPFGEIPDELIGEYNYRKAK